MRVLVVEDDAIAADLLEHALTQFGWDVATATNGLRALELLQGGDFRVVISDWEMPQMTGIELCRQVREHFAGRYIYIILLTSRSGPVEQNRRCPAVRSARCRRAPRRAGER